MKGQISLKVTLFFIFSLLFLPFVINEATAAPNTKQKVYDFADLLTQEEIKELEAMAHKYGAERETDFIILTAKDTEGKDVVEYMQDFYDEKALGYDKPHGNCVILTIDMKHRDVHLATFYKAKKELDDHRLDLIREEITPDLSSGNYHDAFRSFIKTSHRYMGIWPGIDPDSILFNLWFQIVASLATGGIVVGVMAYNAGGRVTVNERTYQDYQNSRIIQRKDEYRRTSVTKRRKPSNDSSSSGGGVTKEGHSHGGSRGSF